MIAEKKSLRKGVGVGEGALKLALFGDLNFGQLTLASPCPIAPKSNRTAVHVGHRS